MTESKIDAERLAALLDGRLDERARAEVLAYLGSSDEALDVLADAAAVMRDLEEAQSESAPPEGEVGGRRDAPEPPPDRSPGSIRDGAALPRPPDHTRTPWKPSARWAALAAVLALAVLIPVLRSRSGAPDPGDPGHPVALLEAPRAGLPAGWTERRPWGATLGPGDPLTPQARAVRFGALHVDLVLAVGARDTVAALALASQLEALLEDVPASGPVAADYQEVGRRSGESLERLEELLKGSGADAAELLGEDWVGLGAWAEAGRVAVARRDADYFRARESHAALDRAAGLPGLPESARAAVERIRAAVRAEGALDWTALERDFGELLAATGS